MIGAVGGLGLGRAAPLDEGEAGRARGGGKGGRKGGRKGEAYPQQHQIGPGGGYAMPVGPPPLMYMQPPVYMQPPMVYYQQPVPFVAPMMHDNYGGHYYGGYDGGYDGGLGKGES